MAGNGITFDDISTGISYEQFPKDPAAREAIAIVNNKVEELKGTTVSRQNIIDIENKVKQSELDKENFKEAVNKELTDVKAVVDGIDGGNTAKLEELEAAVNDKANKDVVDSLLYQIEGSVKQINGNVPDENGNVTIDLNTTGLVTKEEVKSKTDEIETMIFTKAEKSVVEMVVEDVGEMVQNIGVLSTEVDAKASKEEFLNKTNALDKQVSNIALQYKGNGVDDSASLQAFFDYARDNNFNTLKLSGEIVLSKQILYHSNTRIYSDNGVFKMKEGLEPSLSKQMLSPSANGTQNVIIEGITFDHRGDIYGNNGKSPCVAVTRAKNITITNCIFKNVQTIAVWFDDSQGGTENIKVINNTIENSFAGGISVFGYCKGLIIKGNYIKNTRDDAIALQPCSSEKYRNMYQMEVVIEGNVIEDLHDMGTSRATPRGILNWAAVNVVIRGNVIKNTYSHSIYVFDGEEDLVNDNPEMSIVNKDLNTIIDGNVCINAGSNNPNTLVTPANGINVRVFAESRIKNVTVTNNIVVDSAMNGIFVNKCDNLRIAGNTIKNAKHAGIYLDGTIGSQIIDNIIENAGASGTNPSGILLAQTSEKNTIKNNRIYGTSTTNGILLTANATKNHVQGNNVEGVTTYSIRDLGTANQKFENITKSGNPLTRTMTLSANGSTFAVTGVSSVIGSPVLVMPLNDSARDLLLQGYRANGIDDVIEFRTKVPSVGTESILFRVL